MTLTTKILERASAALPAPYDYAQFRHRAVRDAAQRRQRLRWNAAVGALVCAIFGALIWSVRSARLPAPPLLVEQREYAIDAAKLQWLARQSLDPAMVMVSARAASMALEDRIAWYDDLLSDAQVSGDTLGRVNAIQRQRAALLQSLLQVRYAEQLVAASR